MIGRRSRTLTQSITIDAPPHKVWDLITRIDTIADWYDSWDRVDTLSADARLRPGSSFRLIRREPGGGDLVADCRVTELSEAARLQWVQSTPHQPLTSVAFELMCQNDGGTELRQTRTWNPRTVRTIT